MRKYACQVTLTHCTAKSYLNQPNCINEIKCFCEKNLKSTLNKSEAVTLLKCLCAVQSSSLFENLHTTGDYYFHMNTRTKYMTFQYIYFFYLFLLYSKLAKHSVKEFCLQRNNYVRKTMFIAAFYLQRFSNVKCITQLKHN